MVHAGVLEREAGDETIWNEGAVGADRSMMWCFLSEYFLVATPNGLMQYFGKGDMLQPDSKLLQIDLPPCCMTGRPLLYTPCCRGVL